MFNKQIKRSNEDILNKAALLLLEAKKLREATNKLVSVENELEFLAEEMYYRVCGKHSQNYYIADKQRWLATYMKRDYITYGA